MRSGDFEKYQSLRTSPVELRWESLLKGLCPVSPSKEHVEMNGCASASGTGISGLIRGEGTGEFSGKVIQCQCPHQLGTQGACGERSHRGAEQEKGPHCRFPRSTTVLPNPWDMVPAVPWSCCPTVPSHPYVKR